MKILSEDVLYKLQICY